MGLKENFSQAVKELTGNTKEDDKKRNAQVAGLKKALDNDAPFSDDDRFNESSSRPYYRDESSRYDNRGGDPRDMRGNSGSRPDAGSRPDTSNRPDVSNRQGAGNRPDVNNRQGAGSRPDASARDYNDGYGQNGYSRPQNDNYRQYADDRNSGYNEPPRQDDYGVRNYDSYGGGNDRPYDNGRQDNYNNDPYANDRGYSGQPYNDNRGDMYNGQPYNDGYGGQGGNMPQDNRQSPRNDDVQRGGYSNSAQNAGAYDQQRGYDNRQNAGYDQQRGYDNGGRQNDGYDRRGGYDNRQSDGRTPTGSAAERNYNVRSFNNQQRYSQQQGRDYDNGTRYPMGNISRRDYREGSDNELTVISRNTIIDGNVRSFANMSIDGDIRGDVETTKDIDLNGRIIGDIICSNANMMVSQVQGNIQLKGDVEIGRDTLLIGDLNSGFAKINGKIKGNVEVTGKAEFKADAVVFGDISASTITVDDGAIIEGYVSTTFLNKEESERIFPESIEIGE